MGNIKEILHTERAVMEEHIKQLQREEKEGICCTIMMPAISFLVLGLISGSVFGSRANEGNAETTGKRPLGRNGASRAFFCHSIRKKRPYRSGISCSGRKLNVRWSKKSHTGVENKREIMYNG